MRRMRPKPWPGAAVPAHPNVWLAAARVSLMAAQARLFRLSVLLVHVDVEDCVKALGEVSRAATNGDCTLVCAWTPEVRAARPAASREWQPEPNCGSRQPGNSVSPPHDWQRTELQGHWPCAWSATNALARARNAMLQECARWLETFKSYESKPASSIQVCAQGVPVAAAAAALTCSCSALAPRVWVALPAICLPVHSTASRRGVRANRPLYRTILVALVLPPPTSPNGVLGSALCIFALLGRVFASLFSPDSSG
jgi:hypothetical protein